MMQTHTPVSIERCRDHLEVNRWILHPVVRACAWGMGPHLHAPAVPAGGEGTLWWAWAVAIAGRPCGGALVEVVSGEPVLHSFLLAPCRGSAARSVAAHIVDWAREHQEWPRLSVKLARGAGRHVAWLLCCAGFRPGSASGHYFTTLDRTGRRD